MTRTNLATDPRGTGSADLVLAGFDEAAGDPLAGIETSRRFTRTAAERGAVPIENYSRYLTANYGTTTGVVSRTVDGDIARYTYTTQGNTSWSDALVVRPTQEANNTASRDPVVGGVTVVRVRCEFRALRARQLRVRIAFYDAVPAGAGTYSSVYVNGLVDEWTTLEWEYLAPAAAVTASVQFNSGTATGTQEPNGFITGDYVEIRNAVVTYDQPLPPMYFDGNTPDIAPTDTALGYDFAWLGAVNASHSTATPILQSVIGLPYPLPANTDGLFRIRARASAAMPGGRLVVRPNLLDPAGELAVLIGVDLPEGESSVDLPLGTGANPVEGLAFVWGAATGGPPGTSVELTRVLVEVPETPPDPPGDGYFDGWTLDVPPSELTDGIAYTWTGPPDASPSTATTVSRTRRQIREDIAAALSTVPGITGTPTAPRTLGRGQGWPVWQARTPLTITNGDEFRWLVHVTLPAGMPDATVLESDELTAYVLAALSSVGVVERIEPDALIATQDKASQPVPALTVTITTTN